MKNKYKARRGKKGGIVFDSQKELRRWNQLESLEEQGEITNLQRQVVFTLIPAQYSNKEFTKTGKFKCLERKCTYRADFVYKDKEGKVHVEDVKGCKKGSGYNLFVLKRKLMLYVHGIQIEEV